MKYKTIKLNIYASMILTLSNSVYAANMLKIDTYSNKVHAYCASFDDNSNGFVITGSKELFLYRNDKFIKSTWKFSDLPVAISYTGNYVYVATEKELKQCDSNGDNCKTIDSYATRINSIAFDTQGNGFAVNGDGRLDIYMNNKFIGQKYSSLTSVSYKGGAVYLISGKVLKKCDSLADNCLKIGSFDNGSSGQWVSFDNAGNGVTYDKVGYLTYYTNDQKISSTYIGVSTNDGFGNQLDGISYTKNGVYIPDLYELYKVLPSTLNALPGSGILPWGI